MTTGSTDFSPEVRRWVSLNVDAWVRAGREETVHAKPDDFWVVWAARLQIAIGALLADASDRPDRYEHPVFNLAVMTEDEIAEFLVDPWPVLARFEDIG